MRLVRCGLAAAALALAVSFAGPATAQTVVKFPSGPDVFALGPGQFQSLINSYVQWNVVLDNTTGSGTIVFNYYDIMDPNGVRACDVPPACPGADQLELLCDAPYAPDPDGGTVNLCNPVTGEIDMRSIPVPQGTTSCVTFWTRIKPGARSTGGVSNVGCVDIVSPLPRSVRTVPTTSANPSCFPAPAAGPAGCSQILVPNIEPPSFSAVKTATVEDVNGNGVTDPFDIVTWTVDVTNNGTDSHDGYLYDPIPANTTFIDILDNPDGACALRAPNVDCDVLTFAPGETKTLRFRSSIDCSIITNDDTSQACNTAFICNDAAHATCAPSDDDGVGAPHATCVDVPLPDLRASTKAWVLQDDNDGDGSLSTGDRVRFAMEIHNDGSGTARSVVLTDDIDVTCIDETSLSTGAASYDNFTNVLTWNVGDVAPGGFEQNSVSALVTDTGGPCCNQGEISHDALATCSLPPVPTDDPATPAVDDPACLAFGPQPLLHVEKDFTITNDVDGDGQPDDGDELTFTITIRNDGGGAATNVVIDDVLVTCWSSFSASSVVITGEGVNESTELSPPMTPNRVRVTGIGGADGLDPNGAEIVTITYPVIFSPGALAGCCNVAHATYAESQVMVDSDDPFTAFPDDQTCTTRTAPTATLEIVKSFEEEVPDGCLFPGENVTFDIDVTARTTAAQLIQLTDDLTDLAGVFDVVNPNGGTVSATGDQITWSFGDVNPDQTRRQTWIGRFACDAVSGDTMDDAANAVAINAPQVFSAPVTATVSAPTLTATQSFTSVDADGSTTFNAGDTAQFSITVQNTGTCAATNVVVTDALDHDLAFASATASGTPTGLGTDTLRWDSAGNPELASLAPGAGVTYTWSAAVVNPTTNPDPVKDGILTNEVVATGDAPNPSCPLQGRSPTFTKLIDVSTARLDVKVLVQDENRNGCWEPGERVEFDVEVTALEGAAADVVVVLTLDDPADLLSVVDDDGGTVAGNPEVITWNVGTLAADEVRAFHPVGLIACDAADGTVFGAHVNATSSNLAADNDSVSRLTVAAIQLALDKSFTWDDTNADNQVSAGERMKFLLTVRNVGSCQVRSINVQDPLDTDLAWTGLTITPFAFDDGNGLIEWRGLGLNPGESLDLSVESTVLNPPDNPNGNGTVENIATALANTEFACTAPFWNAAITPAPINQPIGVYRLLRNDFITCRTDAFATIANEPLLRQRPAPQECSEPTAIDPTHRGTQVVDDATSPRIFAGDANPASSFPQCPQTLVGFGRVLVFYEVDDPPPICLDSLRVRKVGPDVEVSW